MATMPNGGDRLLSIAFPIFLHSTSIVNLIVTILTSPLFQISHSTTTQSPLNHSSPLRLFAKPITSPSCPHHHVVLPSLLHAHLYPSSNTKLYPSPKPQTFTQTFYQKNYHPNVTPASPSSHAPQQAPYLPQSLPRHNSRSQTNLHDTPDTTLPYIYSMPEFRSGVHTGRRP
jgi:hypothetical protein